MYKSIFLIQKLHGFLQGTFFAGQREYDSLKFGNQNVVNSKKTQLNDFKWMFLLEVLWILKIPNDTGI